MKPSRMLRSARTLAPCALVAGCGSGVETSVQSVQGRRVGLQVARGSGPTVVFESSLDGTIGWWSKVGPEVAGASDALADDRPGYGRSERSTGPRDGTQVVAELRALLAAQRMPGPGVPVGHSRGGLSMQRFARQHPGEVLAPVLVESNQPEPLRGAGAPDRWPAWARLAFGLLTSATARRGLAPPPGTRVIVLGARRPMKDRSPPADDANAKRAALAGLYPGAARVWVDSGHAMPLERPDAVLAAIRDAPGSRR